MKIGYKIWLEKNGKVFGKGPCQLLKKVEKLGSLNKAAKEMEMSYSKAWSIIKKAEKEMGFKLLERQTGGAEGGGSFITKKARELIKEYDCFYREVEESLNLIYEKHFGNFF